MGISHEANSGRQPSSGRPSEVAFGGRRGLTYRAAPLEAPNLAATWMGRYLALAAGVDVACAVLAGVTAFEIRYHARLEPPDRYLVITAILPVLWWAAVRLSGGYDSRIIGGGAEEFHRIVRAGISLTAGLAIVSYAAKL